MNEILIKPIGIIESCFPEKFGIPKQSLQAPSSWGVLKFNSDLDMAALLDGIENFSHLWVLWHFHLNSNKTPLKKIHPPVLKGKKVGVLASRSPHHPNPIGLSVVKIEKINKSKIHVSGLDMVHGTPILDIKPYIAKWDSIPTATNGWLSSSPSHNTKVIFTDEFKNSLFELESNKLNSSQEKIISLINECLSIDVRPPGYRKRDERDENIYDEYAIKIDNFDVYFKWIDNKFLVTDIKFLQKND